MNRVVFFFMFIIKGFQTIVFIFTAISTTFRPICPPTSGVCRTREPRRNFQLRPLLNPVLIPWAISGYNCYSPVVRIEPLDDCIIRKATPITVTLCVLLDSSEWIFGTYKPNVFTWLGLRLLYMIFFHLGSYSDLLMFITS